MQGLRKTRPGRARRAPGQGARERADLLSNRSVVRTAMAQAWAQGAAGEEHVGECLDTLEGAGWTVLHDLRRPGGANVDHVAIGPPGVFVLDTKCVTGQVWVAGPHIRVNNFPQNYLEKLDAQIFYVRERLLDVIEWSSLWVQGVLVFVEPDLTVKQQPDTGWVLSDDEVAATLRALPARFSRDQVAELSRAARRHSTWDWSR